MISCRTVSFAVTQVLLFHGVVAGENSHLRGNHDGEEFVYPSSSAQLLPSSVKIRTTPDAPYRLIPTRGPPAKRRRRADVNATINEHGSDPLLVESCPPRYDPQRSDYVSGDIVEVYSTIFRCRGEPYEVYCNIPTLGEVKLMMLMNSEEDDEEASDHEIRAVEEDAQSLWLNAWEESGECAPPLSENDFDVENISESNQDGGGMFVSTEESSDSPFRQPSAGPSLTPSNEPSEEPSIVPTWTPSVWPSLTSSDVPSRNPSELPSSTQIPTAIPTERPTEVPTWSPTWSPTVVPTSLPSTSPTNLPSVAPSTSYPTYLPTTFEPTYLPTGSPTTSAPTTPMPTSPPTSSPSSSPTFLPTSSPVAMPTSASDSQQLTEQNITCAPSQSHLRIELVTDYYPKDISWQFIDRDVNTILLASPPDGYSGSDVGNGMMEAQIDIREICLNSTNISPAEESMKVRKNKKYEFVVKDIFGDGMCCRSGVVPGHYKLLQKNSDENVQNGEEEWLVLVSGSNFGSKAQHYFEMQHSTPSTSLLGLEQAVLDDSQPGSVNMDVMPLASLNLICPPPNRKITIQIQTDSFGSDISWVFREKNGQILAKNERSFANKVEVDSRDVCIKDSSLYELTINDEFGDGICCSYKDKGHYKILTHSNLSGELESGIETMLHGGLFMEKKITHLINTTLPIMTNRDVAWLNSHNKRRRYWHGYYNTSYVPLLWSEALKAEAKTWSETLLDSCGKGMYHDPKRTFGENAAGNTGGGTWGTRREPEKIVARFVDYEVDLPWPANGHLVQALWRASKYVGCAESNKSMGGGRQCHTQVCRYARTGNCNMGAYKHDNGTIDWKTPMLEDVNYCGPICPTDGCRA